MRWNQYFLSRIGYQTYKGMTAVNYFADRVGNPVPNNSAIALRYAADLANATGDDRHLDKCGPMITFLQTVQRASGEFPYVVDDPRKQHFQCFQYHAFIYLDLWNYRVLTGDDRVLTILHRLLTFLSGAVAPDGFGYYQCDQRYRTVNYHTAAIAAALRASDNVGLSDADASAYRALSDRAFRYLVQQQFPDGAFAHSRGDYHILSDHRRYPRYLAMMLFHLLTAADKPRD